MKRMILFAFLAIVTSTSALKQVNSEAVVEKSSFPLGLSDFSFLPTGYELNLYSDLTVVLGYPDSCRRERITGGTVIIGEGRSSTKDSEVEVEEFLCNIKISLKNEERQDSGAAAWRTSAGANIILYTKHPIFVFRAETNQLFIEKQGKIGRSMVIDVKESYIDFKNLGKIFERGEKYRIRSDTGNQMTIAISNLAKINGLNTLERVVLF